MRSNYDYLFKIIFIGDANVGKSSILYRLSEGTFPPGAMVSFGVDFRIRTINLDGKVIKAQVWGTAGQERFGPLHERYYKAASGSILVYNIDDRGSFTNLENWCGQISKYMGENAVNVLVGNKCDLKKHRQVSYDEGKAYADEMGMQFFETSAKTGENVEKVLLWIVSEIKNKQEQGQNEREDGKNENNTVNLRGKLDEKQGRCL